MNLLDLAHQGDIDILTDYCDQLMEISNIPLIETTGLIRRTTRLSLSSIRTFGSRTSSAINIGMLSGSGDGGKHNYCSYAGIFSNQVSN